jgi:hypothetical protein
VGVLQHAAGELDVRIQGHRVGVEGHFERFALGGRGQKDECQSEEEQFLHSEPPWMVNRYFRLRGTSPAGLSRVGRRVFLGSTCAMYNYHCLFLDAASFITDYEK